MVDKNIVYKYLSSLEENLRRIRRMDFTFDMITGDEDVQDLLDRRMQKAIEACIDIAAHLVSALSLGKSETARGLFPLLAKKGIIDKKLSQRLEKAVGFRNILVHDYTELDYRLAYSDLEDKLKDLESFAKSIHQFIESLEEK